MDATSCWESANHKVTNAGSASESSQCRPRAMTTHGASTTKRTPTSPFQSLLEPGQCPPKNGATSIGMGSLRQQATHEGDFAGAASASLTSGVTGPSEASAASSAAAGGADAVADGVGDGGAAELGGGPSREASSAAKASAKGGASGSTGVAVVAATLGSMGASPIATVSSAGDLLWLGAEALSWDVAAITGAPNATTTDSAGPTSAGAMAAAGAESDG
mmetsp:Transcript_101451/g.293463  ORF Transcript_101451/g.293463 Transcript_101451/m.293463 type:complete len:219 (+) Transcript_101451:1056-1712(+)